MKLEVYEHHVTKISVPNYYHWRNPIDSLLSDSKLLKWTSYQRHFHEFYSIFQLSF